MANRWENSGTVADFIFLGSKITADGDCSHEIKRRLLLGRKFMTNLDSTLKSTDITLSAKVCLVKVMVFPVVMYGCESWTIKKTECRRIDAFELWCWRRLLRVPWTARRSNQSILKEISPGCSLEGLMLKLQLQYFGHLMQRADSFEKTLMLGKIEGRRRREQQRMRWLDGITDSMDMGLVDSGNWWWTGRPGVLQFMGSQRVRHAWATELNWKIWGLPCWLGGKESACQCRGWRFNPWVKLKVFGENEKYIFYFYFKTEGTFWPTQYISFRSWRAEKEMAVCSSILAWEISWTEESGWLQSTWSRKSQTWLSD